MSNCDCSNQSSFEDDIKTRMRAIARELAEMNATKLGGKPNTKQQDGGTSIDHVGYKRALLDELKELRATLNDLAQNGNDIDGVSLSGGFEFTGDYGAE